MTEPKAASIQGWVKTLWPIFVTIIALAMGYQSLSDRMSVTEQAQRDLCAVVSDIQSDQSTMNADISTLKALMVVVSEDTGWMRDNWDVR